MEYTQTVFRMSLWLMAVATATVDVARGQSGEDMALALRPNVVRITAHVGTGTQQGFGFIVGEESGRLYIVTADHVCVEMGRTKLTESRPSYFFRIWARNTKVNFWGRSFPAGRVILLCCASGRLESSVEARCRD